MHLKIYLRSYDNINQVNISLLMAQSKISPLNTAFIERREHAGNL